MHLDHISERNITMLQSAPEHEYIYGVTRNEPHIRNDSAINHKPMRSQSKSVLLYDRGRHGTYHRSISPAISFLPQQNAFGDSFLRFHLSEIEVAGSRYMVVDTTNAGEDGSRSANVIRTFLATGGMCRVAAKPIYICERRGQQQQTSIPDDI